MKFEIPALDQFALQAVDHVTFTSSHEELKFSVEIEPRSITNRVMVGLLDPRDSTGMAVGIYPATGEICDLTNGGGVIGYLTSAPLDPFRGIRCQLVMYRFGRNLVCSAVVEGETFLYPAFRWEGSETMTALVGKERYNGDEYLSWDGLTVEMQELNGVIAA